MSILMPKRVKHRKWHKGRGRFRGNNDTRGTKVSFGSFGLMSLASAWISGRQIEAARRCILRYLKKGGKLWIRIFPAKPITKKGVEVPMGGGKGAVDHYVFSVRPGRVIFELDGVKEDYAKEIFEKAGDKLPMKTKFISR